MGLGIIKGCGSPGFEDIIDDLTSKGGAELGLKACMHTVEPCFEAGVSQDLKGRVLSISKEVNKVIAEAC